MKTRDIRTLLILVRETIIEKRFNLYGMCGVAYMLFWTQSISDQEHMAICVYLVKYRPRYCNRYRPDPQFWWKPGNEVPRLKWLDKHIKMLADEDV